MPREKPVTTIQSDDETYKIEFEWGVECTECGHTTWTTSTNNRISCGGCKWKNNRDQIVAARAIEHTGEQMMVETEGGEPTIKDIVLGLREEALRLNAYQSEGWAVSQVTDQGDIVLITRADIPTLDEIV